MSEVQRGVKNEEKNRQTNSRKRLDFVVCVHYGIVRTYGDDDMTLKSSCCGADVVSANTGEPDFETLNCCSKCGGLCEVVPDDGVK
jgi:hypothetical protein